MQDLVQVVAAIFDMVAGWHFYEVENSYITTKTLKPYFDVSISSRDLHQRKLVLSSSECRCDETRAVIS